MFKNKQLMKHPEDYLYKNDYDEERNCFVCRINDNSRLTSEQIFIYFKYFM